MKNMSVLKNFFLFLKARKKWWLAPVVVALLLIGVLIIAAVAVDQWIRKVAA